MARLLIIDDDKMICETMSRVFTDAGHEVCYALTLNDGLEKANKDNYDVVFMDVRLPDGNGLKYLPMIRSLPSFPEVVIITGYADSDGAEIAMKNNAWDYIKKPSSIDSLMLTLNRSLQFRREKSSGKPPVNLKREGIIGESPGIKACLDLVARAANSMANILITGETGTGKELFSRAIHLNSTRAGWNFVPVDCGSLPETLVESLLFGHTKGAFTGADKAEDGLIKHADKGTLFLDEVGELSLLSQKSLLRVIQERRFQPIGATRETESDFRLVAATNKDLEKLVESGDFREDLLFRLRSININLPPLRERTQDIRELALHYMNVICESFKVGTKGFSPELLEMLQAYHWPGNVRELHGALEWAVTQALHEPTLYPNHLPTHIRIRVARSAFDDDVRPEGKEVGKGKTPTWREFRKKLIENGEKEYLGDLMVRTEGDIKEAAKLSGLSKPRLYELLRKYKMLKKW